jgi:periplasmic mercuric ion binding protein
VKSINLIIILLSFLIVACNGEHVTVSVNTPTIQCGMCQKTIEMGLKKIAGINNSTVDLATKKTKIIYDLEKTDLESIEKAISSLGYQANEKLADPISYESLPACCKIGGMDHK